MLWLIKVIVGIFIFFFSEVTSEWEWFLGMVSVYRKCTYHNLLWWKHKPVKQGKYQAIFDSLGGMFSELCATIHVKLDLVSIVDKISMNGVCFWAICF